MKKYTCTECVFECEVKMSASFPEYCMDDGTKVCRWLKETEDERDEYQKWTGKLPQPKKETMKKYRLVMPDMVHINYLTLAYHISDERHRSESKSCVVSDETTWDGGTYTLSDIPKEWLHVIEEEKVITAQEYTTELGYTPHDSMAIRNAFLYGERNNELRHRETVSCEDAFENIKNDEFYHALESEEVIKLVWNACKNSHGIK